MYSATTAVNTGWFNLELGDLKSNIEWEKRKKKNAALCRCREDAGDDVCLCTASMIAIGDEYVYREHGKSLPPGSNPLPPSVPTIPHQITGEQQSLWDQESGDDIML